MFVKSLTAVVFLTASTMFGALIPIGTVPQSGTGLGSQFTLLTFQATGTESGCVAGDAGGGAITGSSACPAQIDGGDEQAINNVYTATDIGLDDFTNLQVVFNASEPGNVAYQGITLDELALTLWNADDGTILGAFYLENPYVIADAFPGVGNAGFGFELDATQAADANLLLAAFPDLVIGAAATASNASGGLETVFIRTLDGGGGPSEIPEPSTYALGISALAGMFMFRKFRTR